MKQTVTITVPLPKLFRERFDRSLKSAQESVRQLYSANNSRPDLIGSWVAVKFDAKKYMATAHHNVMRYGDKGLFIGNEVGTITPLEAQFYFSKVQGQPYFAFRYLRLDSAIASRDFPILSPKRCTLSFNMVIAANQLIGACR